MTFTPFWTSTPEAARRTGQQHLQRLKEEKRKAHYNPDVYIKIELPRKGVKSKVRAIKKALPYKLRKPEIQKLSVFLYANPDLRYMILPKTRVRNGQIDFSDVRIKYIDEEG